MKRAYLCILADDLPLAAARLGGVMDTCCVVEKQQVICADSAAEALGIHPGISQDTAIALSDQVQLYPRQIDSEQGIMRQLAHWAYRHSSWVHWEQNCLIVEVGGSQRLFGSLESIWQRLHHRALQQIGRCRLALGPHPESAVQLARLGWQTLDIDQAQTWLEHIPLPSLPVPGKLRQRLQSMGFNRVSDLLALPSAELAKRFPMELKLYLDRLMGRRTDPRAVWHPDATFKSTLSLQQSCHTAMALAFPIKNLVDQLSSFLKTQQWTCLSLALELISEDRQTQRVMMNLGAGLHRSEAILEPIKLRLGSIQLTAPVCDIRLLSDSFQDWRGETPDLMKPQGTDSQVELLNALRARLGEHAIWSLGLGQSWLPELANQYQPQGTTTRLAASNMPTRPTWLLPTPLAISPHEFEQIQVLRGPERIEAHWWQDQGARRDYHVADKNGALVWIFQDLRTRQWYLHGLFG